MCLSVGLPRNCNKAGVLWDVDNPTPGDIPTPADIPIPVDVICTEDPPAAH